MKRIMTWMAAAALLAFTVSGCVLHRHRGPHGTHKVVWVPGVGVANIYKSKRHHRHPCGHHCRHHCDCR
jgi:hypothetical protein